MLSTKLNSSCLPSG